MHLLTGVSITERHPTLMSESDHEDRIFEMG